MILPILGMILPTLVSTVEKLIPHQNAGDSKKQLVQQILGSLYDKFLAGKIFDIPGVDEKAVFLEVTSFLIDFTVDKMFNKASG